MIIIINASDNSLNISDCMKHKQFGAKFLSAIPFTDA